MAEVTNESLLEVLKNVQTDIADLYSVQADVKASLERIEGRLNRAYPVKTDIHDI